MYVYIYNWPIHIYIWTNSLKKLSPATFQNLLKLIIVYKIRYLNILERAYSLIINNNTRN